MNAATKDVGKLDNFRFDPDLDEPSYLLGDAAAAAGISAGLLKSWISREPKIIGMGPYDREAHGKGSARLFTLRRVFAIAITAELVRLGVAPSRAYLLAYSLTDCEGLKKMGIKSKTLRDGILVAYPDDETFSIVRPSAPVNGLLQRSRPFEGEATSCIALSYRAIRDRVKAILDQRSPK